MIYNNVLELIGNTPLVRYNDNIVLKLEYFNPSASVKDRASYYMLKSANLPEGAVVIEPTSGNTGVGLAMCCAVMGYRFIATMPETMSVERRKLIMAYGGEIVLTPAAKGMQGAVDKAEELAKNYKNSFIPMQFSNPANPQAHVETTAKEIFAETDKKVDIAVAGIGTGGSAIGLAKGLKTFNSEIKVFGVEPEESPLLSKGQAGPHKIQGIGANFVPDIYRTGELDGIITIKGDEAIAEARNLAREKGIFCGISSGANLLAAKKLAQKPENKDKMIVAIICDTGERYLSTELIENV